MRWIEWAIVGVVVATAAFFAGRHILAVLRGRGGCSRCRKTGCRARDRAAGGDRNAESDDGSAESAR